MAVETVFNVPPDLAARRPIEARGVSRDAGRLLVASARGGLKHTSFYRIGEFLEPGDLIVVNDSETMPVALSGTLNEAEIRLHLSTPVEASDDWLVELREPFGYASHRYHGGATGDIVLLPAGGRAVLGAPHAAEGIPPRLWRARLELPEPLDAYLQRWGAPVRYDYVDRAWELEYYQTIFAQNPGSAEMPSAGRPFSLALVSRLVSHGIKFASITLHTGLASLEKDEPPYAERFSVSAPAAEAVNLARQQGGRIIATGTTVVRALETAMDQQGTINPLEGFTDLFIQPDSEIGSIDGIITGWHEPEATHLFMLEAIAGRQLILDSYEAAIRERYAWHEFGDSHLILRR